MADTTNVYGWMTDLTSLVGLWSIDLSYSLQIVIVVAIAQAILILKLYEKTSHLQAELKKKQQDSSPEEVNKLGATFNKALRGSLDRFSISEVIQFLNSLGETGILDIMDESVLEVHRLMVLDGEIVEAFNGSLSGEPAIRAILGCQEGTFTFIRAELPTVNRTITVSTMSLLMDAHKEADEAHQTLAV